MRTLDSPTWVIGVVFSVGSLGGLIGGLLAGRIGKAVGTARIIWLSQVVAGPFGILAVLAFPGWGLTLVAISIFAVEHRKRRLQHGAGLVPPEHLPPCASRDG